MIIGLIGNCQSREIAKCLARHYPEHNFRYYFTGKQKELETALEDIDTLDIVISQWLPPHFGPLETDNLKKIAKVFIPSPLFSFTGFQPDMTYAKSDEKDFASPVGAYHSRIIISSYLACIPEDRVETLFNSYVYRKFGYFDEYELSKIRFNENFKKLDLDISMKDLEGSAFMHTLNHPTAHAVSLISRALAKKLGLPTEDWSTYDDLSNDGLSDDTIWPVYPELARHLGIEGNLKFKPHQGLIKAGRNALTLREFITESYSKYRERPIDTKNLCEFVEILKREVRV